MFTQYKDSLCTIMIIVALLVISYTVTKLINSRERFTSGEEAVYNQTLEQKLVISKKVSEYIHKDTDYIDYLKFLNRNDNIFRKLVDQDTFYEMRLLSKSGKLTLDVVFSYIKDEK
jgi:hypothetical protein